ncbi:MAG: PQQ-binding-like beta-propeller repeat protein [Polyangiaceae bacterium]
MTSGQKLFFLIGAACAVGCSTLTTGNDRVNPDKPLWFNRPAGAMHLLFLRSVAAESRSVGEAYERGRAGLDIFHGRLFVGTSDHGLYAIRATSGSTIWRFETLGAVHSEPLYDPALDFVYFGSNDGAFYAVHASDGSLVWRFDTGAEISRKAVLNGETLYFANAADNLFAIDRRTARRVWQVHRTSALGMEISGHAGPAIDRGVAFFAFSDGHVGAYDAGDGSERWAPVDLSAEAEQSQGAEALRYLDVDTTPIPGDLGPQGHVIFVASYAGGVYALDQEHGVPVWKNEKAVGITDLALWTERAHAPRPGSPLYVPGGPPTTAREILFASSGESGLWALDPSSGKALWRLPIPEGGITAPVAIAGALLVGTTRYGAFLLSPLDGRPIDGIDLGTGFSQTPAAFGNRAYLLSNAGTLLGLDIDSPLGRTESDSR